MTPLRAQVIEALQLRGYSGASCNTGVLSNDWGASQFQITADILVHHLDKLFYRWVIRKYKKQGSHFKKAAHWVKRIKSAKPNYFVHWELLRA